MVWMNEQQFTEVIPKKVGKEHRPGMQGHVRTAQTMKQHQLMVKRGHLEISHMLYPFCFAEKKLRFIQVQVTQILKAEPSRVQDSITQSSHSYLCS